MLPCLQSLNLSDVEYSSGFSETSSPNTIDSWKSAVTDLDGDASFRTSVYIPLDATATSSIPPPPPAPSSLARPKPCQENPPDLATVIFQQSIGFPEMPPSTIPSIPKSMRNLRLPSFDALGITSPPPKIQSDLKYSGAFLTDVELPADDPLDIRTSSLSYPPAASPPSHSHHHLLPGYKAVKSYVLTHTPPDDSGSLDWTASDAKTAAGAEEHEPAASQERSVLPNGEGSGAGGGPSSGMAGQPTFALSSGRAPWLRDALAVILDIVYQHNQSDAIKILSHALPSPSANGHAFPVVIESIQQSTSSSCIMWMNVWHAVSGRFKFEDLPKSPPTTPAPPFEGDDYFTQRVFDYAVEVPDYSQPLNAQPLIPRQQRPAIAPSSIDISIVERYIPPTSTAEFDELFSVTGRSFLTDRLIELSPSHGTLLFIYPTKVGGETFKKHYLDPILDPTLRSMMISHGLPVTLVEDIGNMVAIRHLYTFKDMEWRLKTFLNTLNNGGTSPHSSSFHRQGANYTLMYAQSQELQIERAVWAQDWWNKQEKLRIQRAFETHDVQSATMNRQAGAFQASAHLATATREAQQAARSHQEKLLQRAQTQSLLRDAERTRGERHPGDNEQLILRLLQQVATKEYKEGPPTTGIEVGVFVVQKTPRSTRPSSG